MDLSQEMHGQYGNNQTSSGRENVRGIIYQTYFGECY